MGSLYFSLVASPQVRGCPTNSKGGFRILGSSFSSRTCPRELSVPVAKADRNSGYRRNKAVAIGAVSYYVDHFVTGRVSKFTYGVPYAILYQPSDPEHTRREHKIYVDAAGDRRISGRFENMLSRVCHLPRFIDPPG